jgi:thioredoxin
MISFIFLGGCTWFSNSEKSNIKQIEKMSFVIPITSMDHFKKEVIKSEKPVVVKFGTVWCGACQDLKPVYESLAQKYKDEMKFVDVDADSLRDLAGEYNIQGYPTIIFFKDGKKVKGVEVEDDELEGYVKEVLK